MTVDPWLVPVITMRRSPGTRREESRVGRVGELRVAGSIVPADAPVEAIVALDSVLGGIEVTAIVSAPWQGECRRCLTPVGGQLRCEVREMFRARGEGESPVDDEETYPLGVDHLDLQPLVRDALLLELPIAPLCRADCLGLCPTCGADLNQGPCPCAEESGDVRWSVLDALRGSPGEGDRPTDQGSSAGAGFGA
jgi:uncharacterized protein